MEEVEINEELWTHRRRLLSLTEHSNRVPTAFPLILHIGGRAEATSRFRHMRRLCSGRESYALVQ